MRELFILFAFLNNQIIPLDNIFVANVEGAGIWWYKVTAIYLPIRPFSFRPSRFIVLLRLQNGVYSALYTGKLHVPLYAVFSVVLHLFTIKI